MSYDKNNSDWRPTRLSGSNGNGDGLPPFDVEAIIRYIKDKFDLIPFFKSYGSVYIILLLIGSFCAFQSIYIVHPDERAVELRIICFCRYLTLSTFIKENGILK